jgi:hypothetical protein
MKNFTKNTIATLALVLLTQTLSASYSTKNSGTLDVTKFSSVWQELNKNDNTNQEHLTSYIENILDSSIKVAYEECTPSIDITKFSSLWQEIKLNDNQAIHLSSALNTVVDEVVCTTIS